MELSGYTALARQMGLRREMQVVANNIANSQTSGFKQEQLIFSEFVSDQGPESGSLSIARARSKHTSFEQGGLTQTNGTFDLALEGDGFFQVETPRGMRLTRAGNFSLNATGELVTASGDYVLDGGGAPIFVPPDATHVRVTPDGTINADGVPISQIGVFELADRNALKREGGVTFEYEGALLPSDGTQVLQGHLESSNVNPLQQISRMIEVQRSYEMGQSFLEAEDNRLRDALEALTK